MYACNFDDHTIRFTFNTHLHIVHSFVVITSIIEYTARSYLYMLVIKHTQKIDSLHIYVFANVGISNSILFLQNSLHKMKPHNYVFKWIFVVYGYHSHMVMVIHKYLRNILYSHLSTYLLLLCLKTEMFAFIPFESNRLPFNDLIVLRSYLSAVHLQLHIYL